MAIDNQFGKGIGLSAGFDLGAQKPLDARVAVNTIAERDAHVTENRAYEGMLVFVDETKLTYQLVNGEWKKFVFNQADFEESFADAIEETNDRLKTLEGLVVGGEGEGLSKVIADVAANKTAVDKLNGGVDEEGSVAKAVADEASIREQADNSLANRIAAFEANGDNDVAALANRVKANEDKLTGLKNATVKAEIEAAQAAAEKHADDAITALVDSAPEAMDTLNELAKAIKDNKDVYDGYIAEHATAMATMKSDLQKEIDADVKVEKDRAEGQEAAIRQEMANAIGNYTEGEKQATGLRKEIAEADAAIRQEMAEAVAGVHNHNNKAVLDGINADKVAAWDGAQAAAEAKAAELDATLKTELQKEIDDDVKVVADELAKQKDAAQEGTLAKQIADVKARLDQGGETETRIAQAESDIDGLQGLVGHPVQAGEGEEEDVPATGLHLALDTAKAELEQAILTEKDRAEGVEGNLQDAIDALKYFVGEEAYKDEELGTEQDATGLVARIAANEAFVKTQPGVDAAQDTRLENLEDFMGSMGEESLELANRIEKEVKDRDAAIKAAIGQHAAEGVEASGLRKEIDDAVAVEKGRAELAEQGLQAAIDAINAVETGILDQAKAHANNLNQAMDARVKDAEAFVKSHDHSVMEQGIADNKAAIEAEVGKEGVQGNRDKAIAAALEAYSTTEEVKQILGNVVNSLALTMENDQVVLKLGGVDGIAITSVDLDMVTDDDIDAIIAGLDEEDTPAEQE